MKAIRTIITLSVAILMSSCLACGRNAISMDYRSCAWSVHFFVPDKPSKAVTLKSTDFECERISRKVFRYTHPDAVVVLDWSASGGKKLEVTPAVTNLKDGYVLDYIEGPFFDIDRKIEDYNLLIPNGYGEIFTRTPADGPEFHRNAGKMEKNWHYSDEGGYYELGGGAEGTLKTPCVHMTMSWFTFAGKKDGVYIASHDPAFSFKDFTVRYYPETALYNISVRSRHILFPGESWTFPAVTVRNYKGDWHAAADIYRSWFNSVKTSVPRPEWMKKSTGWLLTILRQQNAEVIWRYDEIPTKLADIAEARGLDIIGLFGWTEGGHDRFYPNYDVSDELGGAETLRASLDALRARGMRSVIYTNGQLLDKNGTQFWPDSGRFVSVVGRNGKLVEQSYHKYSDKPARFFSLACHSTEYWREKMLSLAKKANNLGADGIIYDQLGNGTPKYCYAPDHGHAVPAIVYEQDRQSNLDYVRSEMAKINPDFIVMTEGTQDAELSAIDLYHGYTYCAWRPDNEEMKSLVDKDMLPAHYFPEMLKYTLPQVECTVRHSCPVADRRVLNYGITFGFKHELETRYAADRKYLQDNEIPEIADYGNVIGKPNLKLVREEDPVATRVYSKQVLDLKRKYADALMYGTFKDNLGLKLETDGSLVAKRFEAADKSYNAVVVWNTSSTEAAGYELKFKGHKVKSVDSPEGSAEAGTIAPDSVHVLIYQ